MDKEDAVYIHNGVLVIKKNEIMPFEPTWIGLEIIILSEVSQRERQIPYDVTCMWNLKKADTDELICKTGTDSQT